MEGRKSRPVLSKYERTTIIGTRMEQLQRGAEPYVSIDLSKPFDPRAIAMDELQQKKLPLMLSRVMPDGSTEVWRLDELM
jgi:DNA-directed RNA polymerase subunit K/omega